MSNDRIVELIAAKLQAGIEWPGDPEHGVKPRPIALPFTMTAGRPKEMQDLLNETTKQLAEAIVHTIETDGDSVIVRSDDMGVMQAAAGETPEKGATIPVYCRCDPKDTPLVMLTMTHANKVVIDGAALIRTLGKREERCPHKWIEDTDG